MNVDHINLFISGAQSVFQQICNEMPKLGKIFLKKDPFNYEHVAVSIGFIGSIKGSCVFTMSYQSAVYVASKMMMGMAVNELDPIAQSAISELTNMIAGNIATSFSGKGVVVDITPPTMVLLPENKVALPAQASQLVCVPLSFTNGNVFELDIYLPD